MSENQDQQSSESAKVCGAYIAVSKSLQGKFDHNLTVQTSTINIQRQ